MTEGAVAHETEVRIDKNFKPLSADIEDYCSTHYTMSDLAVQLLPDIVRAVKRDIIPAIHNKYQGGALESIENYCARRLIDLCGTAKKSSEFWKKSEFAGDRASTDVYTRSSETTTQNSLFFTVEDAEDLTIPLPPAPEFPPQPKELLGVDAFLKLHKKHVDEIPFGLQKTAGGRDEERIYLYSGDPKNVFQHHMYYRAREMEHSIYAIRRTTSLERQNLHEVMTPRERMISDIIAKKNLLNTLSVTLLNESGEPRPMDMDDFKRKLWEITHTAGAGIGATKAGILSIFSNDPRFQTFLCEALSFLQPRQRSISLSITAQPGLTFFPPQAVPREQAHVAATPTRHYPSPMEGID